MRTRLNASLGLGFSAALWGATTLAGPARAEVPVVTADIPAVQSLVMQVMGDLGTPGLAMTPGASPHGYQMRPSEAKQLAGSDVVFWVGPELEPWLGEAIGTLAPDARSVELLKAPGVETLMFRTEALFEPAEGHGHEEGHDHDHGAHDQDDHEGHDHEGHDHEGHDHDGQGHEDHADHDHDHDHAAAHDDQDHDEAHEGHEDDHDHEGAHHHDHSGTDPHAWLDPQNASAWLASIAQTLATADPENAATYESNATAAQQKLAALTETLDAELSDLPGAYVVFHDGYHYLENRFGLPSRGAISMSDATSPSPARLAELREAIAAEGVTCIFAEPQFSASSMERIAEDLDLRTGTLDPLGQSIPTGPDFYADLMEGLSASLRGCLAD